MKKLFKNTTDGNVKLRRDVASVISGLFGCTEGGDEMGRFYFSLCDARAQDDFEEALEREFRYPEKAPFAEVMQFTNDYLNRLDEAEEV